MYKILDQSSSRWADYENVSKSDVYPLQFCCHRWAENKIVAERAIDIWENFVKTVKFWMKSPINDPLITVKIRFFTKTDAE